MRAHRQLLAFVVPSFTFRGKPWQTERPKNGECGEARSWANVARILSILAAWVKGRFPVRAEHLQNTKAALAAAWLGNPDAANPSPGEGFGSVANRVTTKDSVTQAPTKDWQQLAQMLAHLIDAPAIRSRGPAVLCHFPK